MIQLDSEPSAERTTSESEEGLKQRIVDYWNLRANGYSRATLENVDNDEPASSA
ncbi:MAG: hypothetical protein IJ856_01910 [Candidatus Methanomethylophilaceae archaeon]|nr:hypothetical protein [Candidatus Methanomethylophilaceae archaeon]